MAVENVEEQCGSACDPYHVLLQGFKMEDRKKKIGRSLGIYRSVVVA